MTPETDHKINVVLSILKVTGINVLLHNIHQFVTPLVMDITAILSLIYIIIKIKREFPKSPFDKLN